MNGYRLIADFGYGDETWLERFVSEERAIEWFNERNGCNVTNIEDCMDSDRTYYVQVDHSDQDPPDWEDS